MPLRSKSKLLSALALAAVAAPLLAPGVAVAATPTVTFTGGCAIGLLGSSTPRPGSVTVADGGSVTFVNDLDGAANLMIDGTKQATLQAGFQVNVSFHSSAMVSLVRSCLLGGAGTVTVNVTPGSGGSTSPTPGGSPTTGQPPARSPSPAGPPRSTSGAPSQPPASPTAAASSSAPATAGAGSSGPADPSGSVAAGPAVGTGPSDAPQVAIGTSTRATTGHHGADRLLAIIAAVCLIGVTIALIRAIVAQRAIRMLAA